MSGSGKVIQINPELFQMSKKTTRKNRQEKSQVSIPKPIKPNAIKQKLMKRIQEHKRKEQQEKEIMLRPLSNEDDDDLIVDSVNNYNENESSDELNDAMIYFESVKNREKQKQKMLSKTIKHRQSGGTNASSNSNIELLPHLLKPSETLNANTQNANAQTTNTDIVNYILDDLPYGCLKNGSKPTYKTWMGKVKKYSDMSDSDKLDATRPPTPPKKKVEDVPIMTTSNPINKHKEELLKKQINDKLKQIQNEQSKMIENDDLDDASNENQVAGNEKEYIKKTIKRKYTLGKSNKHRKVGILIKGRQTKKNIINSHRNLKRTEMHQIKKYLKKHGMLKSGSNCPDEILRKMYESLILSGDVKNVNEDTLIHNFLHETDGNNNKH